VLVTGRLGDISIPMCLVRVPPMTCQILVIVRRQALIISDRSYRSKNTDSLQPILGIKRAFDLAVEIRKYLFSESLDWIHTLLLA
jgi:hypothetical protein